VAGETGMWNGFVAARTCVDPDTMDSSVRRTGNHPRDTEKAALSTTGVTDAQFLEHRPRKTRLVNGRTFIVQRGITGMGTDQMKQWIQGFSEQHEEDGASVLMLDCLWCHRNQEFLKTLKEANIHIFLMPPQTAKLISLFNNSFFGSLKARLRKLNTSTTEAKKAAFLQFRDACDADAVRHFVHCVWQL
jgi:hypothetical protein